MQDNVNGVLYNLAAGQWAKILEQDLKQRKISTVGHLAALDINTVGQLRGVKPPKQQTVKLALTQYHNKIKNQEPTFRKGTPVQEETSQEEEERIKAEFFSRPSPSPTDLVSDSEIVTETEEVEKEKVEDGSKEETSEELSSIVEDKADKAEDHESEPTEVVENEKNDNAEADPVDPNVVEETSSEEEPKITEEAVTMIPETESIEEESTKEDTVSPDPEEIQSSAPDESTNVKKEVSSEAAIETEQPMETDETSEKEKETRVAEACPTVAEEENKGSEDEATAVEDIVEDSDNITSSPDLSDIMAVLTSDLDLHNQTNDQLHTLYRHLSDHSRQVETMKESVAQVLFGRLDKN